MAEITFKAMLARIKQDFYAKFITSKRSYLTIEEAAQLLYKYMNGEPLRIKQTLLRSTGKNQLVWDDLLQYLQEQLSVLQAVKKIQYSPLSATEIIDRHTNQFGKLISYVKMKETNAIQSIHHVPSEVNGDKIIAVCFEKEIIFYDCNHNALVNHLNFKYTHVRGKLLEKEEQRKISKLQNSQKINIQMSDQVQEIINISQAKGISQRPIHFLTNNMKNSVRGSQLSSEKSNDKMMFRRANTESMEKRRLKSTVTKIKNDDVQKVFHFFEHSSLENSINIAHAFVQARSNFQKSIVLQNSFLEKQAKQRNFDLSSAAFHKNYQRQLVEMKKTNKQLSCVRANLSLDAKSRHQKFYQRKQSMYDRQSQYLFRSKKQEAVDPLQMSSKQLEIINLCFYDQFLLISLFNREIRLFKLKKSLNRIVEELIFQKSYKEVITYVDLYRSKNKEIFHIVIGLEKENQSQVIVYYLDGQMKMREKAFDHEFSYSAKYQSLMPFGLALFNELGYFSVIQLNSSLDSTEEKLSVCTQLFNPETNYRISINQVRINQKQSSIFISCSNGYVYLYDRYIKSIKYQTRICQSPILDICLFHSDEQLLVLYSNGNMAIISTFHLEKIFLYQSYGEISNQSKIFKGYEHNFYVYTSRTIVPYSLCYNEEKQFNNIKSSKILKSRMKLKNKQKKSSQKSRVLRVIEGRGGEEDFLSIILQKGEIVMFNCNLEYVGSYYYFKVLHITELFCNKGHQFIAILLDNNTIEIVNLYTQNLLFTVKPFENDVLTITKSNLRPDSSLYSSVMGHKNRSNKSSTGINLVHFMDADISNCFLSVISKTGKVSNYNEKGVLLTSINLEERLGDNIQGSMIYDDEELVIASDNHLIILYRKSYNRKCVIRVSTSPITKLRKCQANSRYSLSAMDSEENIFLVNTDNKEVFSVEQVEGHRKYDQILFNELLIFKICEQKGFLTKLTNVQDFQVDINHEKYVYSMLDQNVIQVNRFIGKICKFNFTLRQFEDFLF